MGPSLNPSKFLRDQKERKFPTYIFTEEQQNKEKVRVICSFEVRLYYRSFDSLAPFLDRPI